MASTEGNIVVVRWYHTIDFCVSFQAGSAFPPYIPNSEIDAFVK